MSYIDNYKEWLFSDELDQHEKARLASLTEKEKEEMFYGPLAFGTAGMRGILDVGTNRMNVHTVKRATKGLADYVNSLGAEARKRGVVISYDTRRYSGEFAVAVSKVLSANGVKAWLYEDVRPVPMCSFAVRHLGAICGVMITASHNPKEYNGYKVYGEDGAQMNPEATDKVVEFISSTPYFGINEAKVSFDSNSIKGKNNVALDDYITVIGKDVDDKYFDAIETQGLSPEAVKEYADKVKIVYTPIHGSGFMPVTTILGRMGIPVSVVSEQALPDTEFGTVRVPNPEEADTLSMGVELADRIGSDIVIGTDPDADRMGIAVRDRSGKFVLVNGNQIGVLLADYIMRRRSENGTLPENGAMVKTIVTTELARRVADHYGVTTFDVLTGFKFIGEKMTTWEATGEYTYVFGFEESYGSLVGNHARDKDAVVASMLFAEMTCYYASKGKTVYDVLQEIFADYGYFIEKTISITFPGLDGMDKMASIMKLMRETSYRNIAGKRVVRVDDFVTRTSTDENGDKSPLDLPKTNALKLHLDGGDWICVRPSGTEPKLKIYGAASACTLDSAKAKVEEYLATMKSMTK